MKKILVVDDSSVQRKMIIQILRKAGFTNETMEAGDGLEAIGVLGEHFQDIGVVLCDWNMPNMNGLELIEGVGQVPAVAEVPIVMVTTEGTADKIAQARAANSNLRGYVVKPFTPEQLKEAIAPILNAQ
ncbi:MAG: response regulator [Candidatus Omnitrophica bacterium]|nr:response regulator [Candidatus Omnitrophota bacterium]